MVGAFITGNREGEVRPEHVAMQLLIDTPAPDPATRARAMKSVSELASRRPAAAAFAPHRVTSHLVRQIEQLFDSADLP